MMEVIADDPIRESLESLLAEVESENVVLVFLDMVDASGQSSTHAGLDHVLVKAIEGKAVVMLGWMDSASYASDSRWQKATKYPHIIFRRLPVGKQEIIAALAEATV